MRDLIVYFNQAITNKLIEDISTKFGLDYSLKKKDIEGHEYALFLDQEDGFCDLNIFRKYRPVEHADVLE